MLLLACLLLAACSSTKKKKEDAQPATDTPPTISKPKDPRWNAPVPGDDKFDWVQTTSGEWLKGEITAMREGSLEFDSDEFDDMKIDWSDVAMVRSPNSMTVLKEGMEETTGTLLVRRRSALNRLVFEYLGNYGTVDNIQTVNNHRFDGRWDRFVSRRYFITPISLELFRDQFQNTDLRATPAVGFGYHIFDKHLDKKPYDWDIAPFVGYRLTKFISGPVEEDTTTTAGFTTYFNWDITSKSELTFKYSLAIGVPDTTDTNQHLELILSFDLWSDLDLDITIVWDRVGLPRPDADGNFPEPDDFRMSVGIGWDF